MSQKQTHKFKDFQRIQILESFLCADGKAASASRMLRRLWKKPSLVISRSTFHNLLETFRQHGSIHSKLDRRNSPND
jgi:Fe2+ or Zn2+ uptake regulation protein